MKDGAANAIVASARPASAVSPSRGRRALLIAIGAGLLAMSVEASAEEPAAAATVSAPIRAFYDALLDVMKRAKALGIKGRYDALAPVVDATFDLPAMTRIAVGPRWTSLPKDVQSALVDAFSRMTIATYASRFDGYSGERFEVDPSVESRGSGSIVHTRIVQPKGDPVALDYLMRKSADRWKAVDVYLTGTISELATRRSEFNSILDSGGPQALLQSLRQQTERMLQGAPGG
ncbi:MAG TPA: ABC transporter substrate-binding protein [Casimicrobiaceae bacterium]|jgi:phospholipid transport system substrate-binding protein|nr:ABC transporter substrate-binding protein [Casimicrobiaceae bacterium]